MKILEFRDVSKNYDGKSVLSHLSFSLRPGEHLSVMGPSGRGKTTLLRLAAGLIDPDSGEILREAQNISCDFQEPRLVPWLTVQENVELVLKGEDARDQAKKILEETELDDSLGRKPAELSGGMQKRVALARCLCWGGDLILMDEPLSSLDDDTAERMMNLILRRTSGISAVLVTHSLSQAQAFSQKILQI